MYFNIVIDIKLDMKIFFEYKIADILLFGTNQFVGRF